MRVARWAISSRLSIRSHADQLPAVARHGHRKMVALQSGERSRVLLEDKQHVQTSPTFWLSERSSRGGGLNASALGRDVRHLREKCPTRLRPSLWRATT